MLKIEQFHLSHHLVWCKNIEEAVLHVRCKKTDVSDILYTTAPESVIKCKISSQLIMFPSKSYSISANERIIQDQQNEYSMTVWTIILALSKLSIQNCIYRLHLHQNKSFELNLDVFVSEVISPREMTFHLAS